MHSRSVCTSPLGRRPTVLTIGNYVKVKTLEEAYELNQARNSRIMGGMMWMRLGNARVKTIIDMSELGLNEIEETDYVFRIGAMCTLRQLEEHEGLRKFYGDGIAESLRHIVHSCLRIRSKQQSYQKHYHGSLHMGMLHSEQSLSPHTTLLVSKGSSHSDTLR